MPSHRSTQKSSSPPLNPLPLHMPAEWEPHRATWLAWPHCEKDWPGKFETIPWVYAEIIRHLAKYERIELIVNDVAAEKRARRTLQLAHAWNANIHFHRWSTDRVWTRDSGCSFVLSQGSLKAVKWRFNAWAKYGNWRMDEHVGSLMASAASAAELRPEHRKKRIVLEGGAIEVNGQGTLLATEECLLGKVQERNPGMSRRDYEKTFADFLGISQVIWLGEGIRGDDTHGHVDDVTRFVAPDTVVTSVESDPQDPNYEPLRENLRRLRDAVDQSGNSLSVIDLPLPAPLIFEGRRLPASYANFYIANGLVLVPVFNDPNDRVALDIVADLFPDREVIGIYCGDLVWGFGAIHCMTQQQPEAAS